MLFHQSVMAIEAGISFTLREAEEIKLRVTKIPTKYSWVDRELDGKVQVLEIGSELVFENVENYTWQDPYGSEFTLPAGSKFYARVAEYKQAQKFNRNGKMQLNFYKLEIPAELSKNNPLKIDLNTQFTTVSNSISKIGLNNIGSAVSYTAAGLIAAPLLTFLIGAKSLVGIGLATNPYVLGASSALGGAAGLVYGLKKRGKEYRLEPGSELTLRIDDTWSIIQEAYAQEISRVNTNNDRLLKTEQVFLEINKIKKSKDEFGDKCLKINLHYKNNTGEVLTYNSFILVDSMNKEYEPSLTSITSSYEGELSKEGILDLYYPVEFLNTIHELKVVRNRDQKILANAKVVMKH